MRVRHEEIKKGTSTAGLFDSLCWQSRRLICRLLHTGYVVTLLATVALRLLARRLRRRPGVVQRLRHRRTFRTRRRLVFVCYVRLENVIQFYQSCNRKLTTLQKINETAFDRNVSYLAFPNPCIYWGRTPPWASRRSVPSTASENPYGPAGKTLFENANGTFQIVTCPARSWFVWITSEYTWRKSFICVRCVSSISWKCCKTSRVINELIEPNGTEAYLISNSHFLFEIVLRGRILLHECLVFLVRLLQLRLGLLDVLGRCALLFQLLHFEVLLRARVLRLLHHQRYGLNRLDGFQRARFVLFDLRRRLI